jgi:hypothetical protein
MRFCVFAFIAFLRLLRFCVFAFIAFLRLSVFSKMMNHVSDFQLDSIRNCYNIQFSYNVLGISKKSIILNSKFQHTPSPGEEGNKTVKIQGVIPLFSGARGV